MPVHLFCGHDLSDEHESLHYGANGSPLRCIYDTGMVYAFSSQSKEVFILRDNNPALMPG